MKKILVLLLAGVLLMTGCSKTGENGEVNPPGNGGQTGAFAEISEEEIRKIVEELLPKAFDVDSIILFGDFELNENEEIVIENEHGGDIFYPVTDKRFASLEDLEEMVKEIYSERIYNLVHANHLHSPWSAFAEQSGKLYGINFPIGDLSMVDWSLEEIKPDYVQGNRVTFFATAQSGEERFEGRMAIVNEDGMWKFDTPVTIDSGVPYDPTTLIYMEPDISDREKILQIVQAQWPDENLADYFIEIESKIVNQAMEFFISSDSYYAVNLYQGEHLAKRLYVPIYDTTETIEPEANEHGILRRDFTNNINQDADELFGYVTGNGFEVPMNYFDYIANFEEAKLVEDALILAGSVGEDVLIVVPKYYGDLFIIKDKEGNVMNTITNQSFVITPSMDGEIIIVHQGREYSVMPSSDPSAKLPKGVRIDFDYPEAMG